MQKHAYLIIAHTNSGQLKRLIALLDDVRNDIYVLIDKKSKLECDFSGICTKSGLKILPRRAIMWGGISLIEAELSLFSAAYANGPYQYYHLLSGMDLPLHNQDYIHAFFDRYNGFEFFSFVGDAIYTREKPDERIRFYHPFQNMEANRYIRSCFIRLQNLVLIPVQKFLNVNRLKQFKGKIGYGSNWVSITEDFVKYMISQEGEILLRYQSSLCCDEIYKHTLLINSDFSKKLFCTEGLNDKPEDKQGNLRYINWWDGSPKIWTINDMEELKNAMERGYLFSRKFNEQTDSEIIDWIADAISVETYKHLYGDFTD